MIFTIFIISLWLGIFFEQIYMNSHNDTGKRYYNATNFDIFLTIVIVSFYSAGIAVEGHVIRFTLLALLSIIYFSFMTYQLIEERKKNK